MFVTEGVFISEQIAEWMFGALLEVFSSKLNVFSYMILQCWINILESFVTILFGFEKHSAMVVLSEKA